VTTIYLIVQSLYLGFSLFMVTRIGNLVGENSPKEIIALVKKVFILSIVSIYSVYIILYIFQNNIV
jgi:Na+-driven multidrug efflux pump